MTIGSGNYMIKYVYDKSFRLAGTGKQRNAIGGRE
jgi:hypothetical protein